GMCWKDPTTVRLPTISFHPNRTRASKESKPFSMGWRKLSRKQSRPSLKISLICDSFESSTKVVLSIIFIESDYGYVFNQTHRYRRHYLQHKSRSIWLR